ncbi:MAG: hypothetical protein LBD99_04720 [Candidatus Margulisbacteria bacterium]|jgi:uncharacterized DUF497 family protein|nr:hypothetical protein [Candidatus Margulisiibacteriota bacterium]
MPVALTSRRYSLVKFEAIVPFSACRALRRTSVSMGLRRMMYRYLVLVFGRGAQCHWQCIYNILKYIFVDIIWDETKNSLLKKERNVCFEEAHDILLRGEEKALIENPARKGRAYCIVKLNNYINVVPALINKKGQIVLKTIFPSRKYHKLYGG